MTITIELPVKEDFLRQLGMTGKDLEEFVIRAIYAKYVFDKIEKTVQKYKDVLPQTDEEVMNLIDEIEKDEQNSNRC